MSKLHQIFSARCLWSILMWQHYNTVHFRFCGCRAVWRVYNCLVYSRMLKINDDDAGCRRRQLLRARWRWILCVVVCLVILVVVIVSLMVVLLVSRKPDLCHCPTPYGPSAAVLFLRYFLTLRVPYFHRVFVMKVVGGRLIINYV